MSRTSDSALGRILVAAAHMHIHACTSHALPRRQTRPPWGCTAPRSLGCGGSKAPATGGATQDASASPFATGPWAARTPGSCALHALGPQRSITVETLGAALAPLQLRAQPQAHPASRSPRWGQHFVTQLPGSSRLLPSPKPGPLPTAGLSPAASLRKPGCGTGGGKSRNRDGASSISAAWRAAKGLLITLP